MTDSKLSLIGPSKSFGRVPIVEDVTLSLCTGEFVSLLGPSGCGKTTTLRMIAGFINPRAGRIKVNGQTVSTPNQVVAPERRGMSMIFQSYAIWPNMTVGQNVAFGLKLRKLSWTEITERVNRILDTVQLRHLKDRYPAKLSGGQQQRVALARAIVIEPELLLLDEALSSLDANLREDMRSEIRRLRNAFKITTVYVTHDQAEAMVTSDRIVVVNRGRIEQVDDPVTMYRHLQSRFVATFIGRTNLLDGKRDGRRILFQASMSPWIAHPRRISPAQASPFDHGPLSSMICYLLTSAEAGCAPPNRACGCASTRRRPTCIRLIGMSGWKRPASNRSDPWPGRKYEMTAIVSLPLATGNMLAEIDGRSAGEPHIGTRCRWIRGKYCTLLLDRVEQVPAV